MNQEIGKEGVAGRCPDGDCAKPTTETWRERLAKERDELANRIDRLKIFVTDMERESVGARQETLLQIQLAAMQTYLHILNARLSDDW